MKIEQRNYENGNTNFDKELETRMLSKKAQEFKDGMLQFFKLINDGDDITYSIVEMVNAWVGFQFVARGTLFKHLGSTEVFDFSLVTSTEEYMYYILTKKLNITPVTLRLCFHSAVKLNKDDVYGKEIIFNILKDNGDI